MGVMVVVPSFAAGEESDPPGVAGVVLGVETAGTVEVGGGVDELGCVKAEGHAQEDAPGAEADADLDAAGEGACGDEGDGNGDHGDPVILGEPEVEAVAGEIGHVAGEAD